MFGQSQGAGAVGGTAGHLLVVGMAFAVASLWHAERGLPLSAAPNAPLPAAAAVSPSAAGDPPPAAAAPAGATAPLPSHVFLGVPFTPQSPFGDWSQPYQDACEEASAAMAVAWARGEGSLPPERADLTIQRQVAWEEFHFGYHRDTALRETFKLITRYYGHASASLAYDVSAEDVKRELAAGNVVLLPVAGELLPNPYYASPPAYHMVVVRGYDEVAGEFIVNDPGTRRGESYRYPYGILWAAVHDWTGSEETVRLGRKGMIVVRPAAG